MRRIAALGALLLVIGTAGTALATTYTISGTAGNDTICLLNLDGQRGYCSAAGVGHVFPAGTTNVNVSLGAGNDTVAISSPAPGCECLCQDPDYGLETFYAYGGYSVTIIGDAGADHLYAGAGPTTMRGDDIASLLTIIAGAGSDWLMGYSGIDSMYGGDNYDAIVGRAGLDVLYGEAGDFDCLQDQVGNYAVLDCGPGIGDMTTVPALNQVNCEVFNAMGSPCTRSCPPFFF
jgi:Ca2+-binding RTX toxin-like protein